MAFKINKTKEYAILYLHRTVGMSIESVAETLSIAVSSVKKALEENPVDKNAPNNFIHETNEKRSRNVVIMTKEGSQLGDTISSQPPNNRKQTIFKPHG
jgi:hypothetical protein